MISRLIGKKTCGVRSQKTKHPLLTKENTEESNPQLSLNIFFDVFYIVNHGISGYRGLDDHQAEIVGEGMSSKPSTSDSWRNLNVFFPY